LRLWPAALYALKRGKTPDIKTFALGRKLEGAKLSSTAVENMLGLCQKIDPELLK